jgi:hypothetical protein
VPGFCVSSDSLREGMTEHTGATVATQTQRQIVVAVDDSPHSHSAWLWVVENVLRDQDEIILLHGVTTNVRSHRRCTDANPQQAALPPVPSRRAGGLQRDVTANPKRMISLTVWFRTHPRQVEVGTAENPGGGFIRGELRQGDGERRVRRLHGESYRGLR